MRYKGYLVGLMMMEEEEGEEEEEEEEEEEGRELGLKIGET